MAVTTYGQLTVSDADPADLVTLEGDLLRPPYTQLCVCGNRKAPTDKRVLVLMWTRKPSTASFLNPCLLAGETSSTSLAELKLQVIAFEIRWQVPSTGSPMWATTGRIDAAPGQIIGTFGIRWDEHDLYSVIYPF